MTKPVKLQSTQLHLNAKADFGDILVQVVGPGGEVIAQSKALQQDALDIAVQWQTEFREPPVEPVRLRIRLNNARLFALWCR